MSSSSFPPGTKVKARAKNKFVWRFAKVVEPPPDPPANTVTVTFTGRTEQVHLPLQNVKLLDDDFPNRTVDLTEEDPDDHQHENSSQAHQTPPLPTFSDPYNDSQPTTPTLQSTDQPLSTPSLSHPTTDAPQQSIPENTKQSSRDWLLARPSTQPDRNPDATQAASSFRPPQRQPQVVRDPSFPPPPFPPQPHRHGNPESLSWDPPHQPPAIPEPEPSFSFPPGHEQNFVPSAQKGHPQGFQFKAVRTQTKPSSQTLPPPLPRDPSHRAHIPSQSTSVQEFPTEVHRPVSTPWPTTVNPQINSNSRSAWSRGSSKPLSSASPRNGVTPRNPERHPHRSVDEHLRIPRTTVAQNDLPRVPRHPQSSFDDDFPIPRNALLRRSVTNSAEKDAPDTDGSNVLYPASKRQRVGYRHIPWCQMPPSAQAEAAMHKRSRRLAKREREQGWNHGQSSPECVVLRSPPYQRPLQRENGIVRIAPDFDSSQTFARSSEETSAVETKLLEEVLADLSVNSDDIDVGHHGVVLSQMRRRTASLVVTGGGRKKSNPKKWCRARSDDRRGVNASSEFNFCESGISSSYAQGQAVAPSDSPLGSSIGELKDVEKCPIPRVYRCSCQDESEERRSICNDRYSIQCCMCTLWSHMECIGFDPEEIRVFRERAAMGEEKYICIECVDVASGSIAGTFQGHLFENVFQEGAILTSSARHNFSHLVSGLSVTTTDTLSHLNVGDDKCIGRCVWIREPLVRDEISARVNNLEQLREGVTNASVGMRERSLFDHLLGDRRYQPSALD